MHKSSNAVKANCDYLTDVQNCDCFVLHPKRCLRILMQVHFKTRVHLFVIIWLQVSFNNMAYWPIYYDVETTFVHDMLWDFNMIVLVMHDSIPLSFDGQQIGFKYSWCEYLCVKCTRHSIPTFHQDTVSKS